MGKYDKIASDTNVADLTDAHVETYVKFIMEKENILYEPQLIEKAIQSLEINTYQPSRVSRNTVLLQIFNLLEGIWYSGLRCNNSEPTVTLLMQHLYVTNLKAKMHNLLDLNNSLKRDARKFIAKLTSEAVHCQVYSLCRRHCRARTDGKRQAEYKHPLCLWKPRREKRIHDNMLDYTDCPKDEKQKLLDE